MGAIGMNRRWALGGLASVGGVLAAACGGQGASVALPEPSKQPVTIRAFIGGISGAMVDRWGPEIAAPLKQQRPNVTLELVPQSTVAPSGATAEVMEKLTALIAGGDPPEMIDLPRAAAQLVQLGFLDETLDAFLKRDKFDTKQFNQKEFERRAVYQGKVWQVPYKYLGNALVVVCNRSLFSAAGVPLPSTDPSRMWDFAAFTDALVRLTKRSGGSGGPATQFGSVTWGSQTYTWPLQWQADWISADGKAVTCDAPDMLDCYTKWLELFHRHNVLPRSGELNESFGTTNAGNLFKQGKAALAIMSPGTWNTYVATGEVTDIALAPLPKAKVSTPDIASSDLGIARGTKKAADTWEAIKYLAEGSRLALFARYVPAIPKDIEPWAREDLKRFPNADVKVVLRALETHLPNSNLSGHRKQDDLLRAITPALDDMLAGKEAPTPQLRRLKPELQGILDR